MLDVAETADTADDQDWLKGVLAGKDTITGSAEADSVFWLERKRQSGRE